MTPKKEKTPSFGEAITEVEGILSRLEADEIDIDDLSSEVKRAVTLVDACRDKLRKTEMEIKAFVDDLDQDEPPGHANTDLPSGD